MVCLAEGIARFLDSTLTTKDEVWLTLLLDKKIHEGARIPFFLVLRVYLTFTFGEVHRQ